jgi:tetratricopeptide (TPR) repeat protein
MGRAVGKISWQVKAWSQLRDVSLALSDPQGALAAYEKILPLLPSTDYNYVKEKVDVLLRIGKVYRALGKSQQALEVYNQALVTSNDEHGEGERRCLRKVMALSSIGETYVEMGDFKKAFYYFDQILNVRWLLKPNVINFDPTNVINNQGRVYFSSRDILKALDFFDRSFQAANQLSKIINTEINSWNSELDSTEYGLDLISQKIKLGIQRSNGTIHVLNQLYPGLKNLDYMLLYLRKIKQCEALKSKLESVNQRREQLTIKGGRR